MSLWPIAIAAMFIAFMWFTTNVDIEHSKLKVQSVQICLKQNKIVSYDWAGNIICTDKK